MQVFFILSLSRFLIGFETNHFVYGGTLRPSCALGMLAVDCNKTQTDNKRE